MLRRGTSSRQLPPSPNVMVSGHTPRARARSKSRTWLSGTRAITPAGAWALRLTSARSSVVTASRATMPNRGVWAGSRSGRGPYIIQATSGASSTASAL